ncbi:hypothetical protein L1987_50919 [Smallanthus sonchifolius]|nr:hypothetical protein L1987_50919 [Smallanthus sonchifolius]
MAATDTFTDIHTAGFTDGRHRRHRTRYNRRITPPTKPSSTTTCAGGDDDYDDDDDDDDDDEVVEEIGEPMELGCDCKGDLATAHMKCAVTWFLIKGDLTCEICGAIVQNVCEMAQNVTLQDVNHDDTEIQILEESFTGPVSEPESESSLIGHKLVNVLLGCMVSPLSFRGCFTSACRIEFRVFDQARTESESSLFIGSYVEIVPKTLDLLLFSKVNFRSFVSAQSIMAANNNMPTALDKEQIFGMAEKEMEYRVELFNKLTHTCFAKCVEKRYKESELNMGENSCIDRCVSKYWQVTNLVGQLLGSGRPPM